MRVISVLALNVLFENQLNWVEELGITRSLTQLFFTSAANRIILILFQITYHSRTKKDNSNMRTLYLSAYEVEEFESWLSSLRLGRE